MFVMRRDICHFLSAHAEHRECPAIPGASRCLQCAHRNRRAQHPPKSRAAQSYPDAMGVEGHGVGAPVHPTALASV